MSQISIIVPAYNVEQYIHTCFNSIIEQSFTDFEVIVINDGSTDQTLHLLREWEQRDSRIKVIDKKNEGVGMTRNMGLRLATSPYVIFIDPDDSLHFLMLEKLYDAITSNQASMAICGYYDCFEDSDKKYEISMPSYHQGAINLKECKNILMKINPAPWNKLIERKLLVEHSLFFPIDYRSEDLAFTIKLLSHCQSIAIVEEPLYYYLANRSNNVSSAYDERILHTITALKDIMSYYQQNKLFKTYHSELEMIAINQVLYELQKVIYIKDSELAMKIINEFYYYLDSEFGAWKSNPYYVKLQSELALKDKLRSKIYASKSNLKIFYRVRRFLKS